jgi:membrane-associated phospholipid phosphatase
VYQMIKSVQLSVRLIAVSLIYLILLASNSVEAQVKDTTINRQSYKAFILPSAMLSYGLISLIGKNPINELDRTTRDELQEDHPKFAAHADDFLQFTPAAAVYTLQLVGIQGRHNLSDATGIFLMSELIMNGSVRTLKSITHRDRPDHSGFNSFPSGHTANAFATAEFLNQEYKDVSPWYGYAGYTVATATGLLRMYNNRHWLSDVVAGAGIGILSTKVTYLVYPCLRRTLFHGKSNDMIISPGYQNGNMSLNLMKRF